MTILRPLLLVAVIGAIAVAGTQWRGVPAGAAVPSQRPRVPVEAPTERLLELEDDTQYRRGPHLPAGVLRGFALPAGYELPTEPELLPGSPREYRGGFHEGVDFPLSFGVPVTAAKTGIVTRVDIEYVEWSVEEQIAAEDVGFRLGYTPEAILDKLRGRQVWIDHGHGVVTRYAHLDSVEPLVLGSVIERGALIGRVGNSGTKAGPHLHIEIRVGDSYLGDGLEGPALERVMRLAFR